MRRLALFVAVGVLSACGGSGTPEHAVSGIIGGAPFQAKGAVAFVPAIGTCQHGGTSKRIALLAITVSALDDSAFLSTPGNACTWHAGERSLGLTVATFEPANDPHTFAPGTYEVHDDAAGTNAASVVRLDGQCTQLLPNELATSGTIRLTSVATARVAGSVDVRFADGGNVSGSFDAPVVPGVKNTCDFLGLAGGTPGPGCPTVTCLP